MPDVTLDVREIPKPQRHPKIFGIFDSLDVGEAIILINDHDPRHLHDEFDERLPGGYGWDYLVREKRDYRIRISKTTAAPPPRLLGNTAELTDGPVDAAGVAWKLDFDGRGLDSNLIRLAPGGGIDTHRGAEVDVLIHVVAGSGTVGTETGDVAVSAGDLLWLPRRSERSFTAGPDGLSYLTVHTHREPTLTIEPLGTGR
ncbi:MULTISPECIES: DUF2249 domain-containing protein [Gordonia]|uniref:DUF2249 domain-containing protein n=2 Tax=Gordonia TaxID=2053 RepID=L7LI36_9ACTN|nr:MULTISPECIES: DUF2249 domain-containing protein [Gordonia]AUH68061.1 DUF2249 domain-containing protein [Gordonia sp. YC-JH1]KJR05401.1 hypothetical protein UG54_16580 [Gordonia sihwensis]KXT58883.1 hypothetical protein Y710_01155 [Gordonia sp. QH-12]MBY4569292.1 hypothetical protein [Gordonia sihwensis]WFN92206.1 DUF2249 domain-containing protein [Gordonia sihwensis]